MYLPTPPNLITKKVEKIFTLFLLPQRRISTQGLGRRVHLFKPSHSQFKCVLFGALFSPIGDMQWWGNGAVPLQLAGGGGRHIFKAPSMKKTVYNWKLFLDLGELGRSDTSVEKSASRGLNFYGLSKLCRLNKFVCFLTCVWGGALLICRRVMYAPQRMALETSLLPLANIA